MKAQRLSTARKLDIVHAYVMATKGVVPTDLDKLLRDMRERIGDITEADVRKAIKWALRNPKPPPRGEPKQAPRLRLVQ